MKRWMIVLVAVCSFGLSIAAGDGHQATRGQGTPEVIPSFAELTRHPVRLKKELEGVHPRVFFRVHFRRGFNTKSAGCVADALM